MFDNDPISQNPPVQPDPNRTSPAAPVTDAPGLSLIQQSQNPAPPIPQPPQPAPSLSQPVQPQPSQVSNTQQAIQSPNPSVRRAGWVRTIAETLAGGPRYNISIDPYTGETTRTTVPVSGRQLGLAIALE